eukprot:3770679-Rhodomonas_salina.1
MQSGAQARKAGVVFRTLVRRSVAFVALARTHPSLVCFVFNPQAATLGVRRRTLKPLKALKQPPPRCEDAPFRYLRPAYTVGSRHA